MLEAPEEEEPGEEELVPETPHLVPIRNCLALVGPELQPDSSYPVGQFEVPGDGTSDPIRIAVVAVAEVDGRVVITIPFTAWHRTVARRVLPATALQKPLPLTVEVVDRSTTGLLTRLKIHTLKQQRCGLDCYHQLLRTPSSTTRSPLTSRLTFSLQLTRLCPRQLKV